jgi:tRNA G18 (ribose-2'-O)-methylase SpoU
MASMSVERVTEIDDPRLADYRNVPDPVLLRERGIFIAEGRHVVRTLLTSGRHPIRSLLVSPPAYEALADVLDARPGLTVFVAPPVLMEGVVGFDVHRGCLAAGGRAAPPSVDEVIAAASPSACLLIADGVANADNMGALFRNARAFGAGGVLLSPACCDPLYRKSIRVSIGASLLVPYADVTEWPGGLSRVSAAGYRIVALTVRGQAAELEEFARALPPKLAWLLGHEGHGVSPEAAAMADATVRIAMEPGADSINVAVAAGIAMYASRRRQSGFPASPRRTGVD